MSGLVVGFVIGVAFGVAAVWAAVILVQHLDGHADTAEWTDADDAAFRHHTNQTGDHQ